MHRTDVLMRLLNGWNTWSLADCHFVWDKVVALTCLFISQEKRSTDTISTHINTYQAKLIHQFIDYPVKSSPPYHHIHLFINSLIGKILIELQNFFGYSLFLSIRDYVNTRMTRFGKKSLL